MAREYSSFVWIVNSMNDGEIKELHLVRDKIQHLLQMHINSSEIGR
jgi:hypothetical protein